MSSIKRDVKKKVSSSTGRREDFCLEIQPTACECSPDSLERVRCGLFAISVLSSSGSDDANRVLDLASGPGIWVSTMVLLEARGLSLFLVMRGGIACISDSVPKHTRPNSLTDTHLEPSVSRTRPTTISENRRRWKGLFITDAQASCRCNCVASKSTPFFQILRVMLAIFRARVRRAIVGRIPFSRRAT
jgi:hypothetical protein